MILVAVDDRSASEILKVSLNEGMSSSTGMVSLPCAARLNNLRASPFGVFAVSLSCSIRTALSSRASFS